MRLAILVAKKGQNFDEVLLCKEHDNPGCGVEGFAFYLDDQEKEFLFVPKFPTEEEIDLQREILQRGDLRKFGEGIIQMQAHLHEQKQDSACCFCLIRDATPQRVRLHFETAEAMEQRQKSAKEASLRATKDPLGQKAVEIAGQRFLLQPGTIKHYPITEILQHSDQGSPLLTCERVDPSDNNRSQFFVLAPGDDSPDLALFVHDGFFLEFLGQQDSSLPPDIRRQNRARAI